jgi:hypothetical protein
MQARAGALSEYPIELMRNAIGVVWESGAGAYSPLDFARNASQPTRDRVGLLWLREVVHSRGGSDICMLHHVGRVAKAPLSPESMLRSSAGTAWIRRVHQNAGRRGERRSGEDLDTVCVIN